MLLLILGGVLVWIVLVVLILALCAAAGRADRRLEEMRRSRPK